MGRWFPENRRPLVTLDIQGTDSVIAGGTTCCLGILSYLGIPMFSKSGKIRGVVRALTYQPREFGQDEVDLLQLLANGAAVALENAHLFEQVQRKSKELQEAYEVKSNFFNTMAHELKTPLHVLIGTQKLMADGLYGKLDERAKQGFETIGANVRSLLDLINEILELARIEAKRVLTHIEPFLRELCQHLD